MARPWPVLLMARELGIGGTERQLSVVAKSLDPKVFRPHAGVFRPDGFRADELRASGIPVATFPVRSFRSLSVLTGAWELARYCRSHGIRLVHTFDAPLNAFGVPVARTARVPVVLSSTRAHRDLAGSQRRLLRATDRMVDGIVVNSKAMQRHLVEDERVPERLIHLCYNGIDLDRFRPGPRNRPEALREAHLVIGVVCALRPEKDLRTLIEAFVRAQIEGAKLLIVGSGPVRDELERYARERGARAACHFEPATGDVPKWLRAIDIFVLPSLTEALSNSLMEAMACGCCAVASDVGGNPELVEHDRTGLLFPARDAAALTASLVRLASDAGYRERLAEEGARFMYANFSTEASVSRMAEIYRAFLERADPDPAVL